MAWLLRAVPVVPIVSSSGRGEVGIMWRKQRNEKNRLFGAAALGGVLALVVAPLTLTGYGLEESL